MKLTDHQYQICKCISKNNHLNYVLKKCNIPDYLVLQDIIETQYLRFSDFNMDDQTQIFITNELQAEFDDNRHLRNRFLIPTIISIIAITISILALICSLID